MNNNITNELVKDLVSALPKEVFIKYGWILLSAPFVYAFGINVMEKGYNMTISLNPFTCELTK